MVAFVIEVYSWEMYTCNFALSDDHFAHYARYNKVADVIVASFPDSRITLGFLDTLRLVAYIFSTPAITACPLLRKLAE